MAVQEKVKVEIELNPEQYSLLDFAAMLAMDSVEGIAERVIATHIEGIESEIKDIAENMRRPVKTVAHV
jgi:hypothetical protein